MNLRRALAFALGLSLCAPVASAKEPTPDEVDRARTLFNAGAQAYSNAQYFDAVRSFEQAYAVAPRPQLLFSLAQAERKQFFASNDASYLRHAIAHYKEYLEQVPSGGRRSEATEAKADLEARLARLDPQQATSSASSEKRKPRVTVYSATPGALVSYDGGKPQELPFFGDLEPGKHHVRVFADGFFDEQRDISGDRNVDQPLDVPLRERPASVTIALDTSADIYVDGRILTTTPLSGPIEIAPGSHVISVSANGRKALSQEIVLPRGKPYRFEPKLETSGQRVVAYTLLGVGGAGILTGAAFGLVALGQEGHATNVRDTASQQNISSDDLASYNRAIDRRDAFRTVSIVAMSAGAAVAAGGAALFFFDRPSIGVVAPRSIEPTPQPRKPDQPLDLTAYPVLGPGTWGGGLTARF